MWDISDNRIVEPLIAALMVATDYFEREYIAIALGVLGDTRAVEPLIKVVEECPVAANSLGRIGDLRAVEPLIKYLGSSDDYVRYYATQALGMLADSQALSELERLSREDTTTVEVMHRGVTIADEAKESIERIKWCQYSVRNLINALSSTNEKERRLAIFALSKVGDASVLEELNHLIKKLLEIWERKKDSTEGIVSRLTARETALAAEAIRKRIKQKQRSSFLHDLVKKFSRN